MWAIENRTPYSAAQCFLRDKDGARVWVVAVRATFDIAADGSTLLAPKQEPVALVPVYSGKPGSSSLLYETDLVLGKGTTDVILHGHAHAPKGKTATELQAALSVGPVKKVLTIVGDRRWVGSGPFRRLGKPLPFTKMAIVYERAFGGTDPLSNGSRRAKWETRNPVGTGFAVRGRHPVGQRAPNVFLPNRPNAPAGFGPIPRDWAPRLALAGTYDQKWRSTRHPLPPSDFDERFYQCAPEDQQALSYLKGGESVVLVHLTPEGLTRFNLPKMRLVFHTLFGIDDLVHHRANLHTVILEPDQRRLQMVWHTQLRCHSKVYKLKHTVVREKKYVRLSELRRDAGSVAAEAPLSASSHADG
jgi:hypothetical protein